MRSKDWRCRRASHSCLIALAASGGLASRLAAPALFSHAAVRIVQTSCFIARYIQAPRCTCMHSKAWPTRACLGSQKHNIFRWAQNKSFHFRYLYVLAVFLTNLAVDASSSISIPLATLLPLGGAAWITVTAVAGLVSASTSGSVEVPLISSPYRPLQLQYGLDSSQHYTQQRKVATLQVGDSLGVTVSADSNAVEYDSLSKLYAVFCAYTKNDTLSKEFDFLVKWGTLSEPGT
jgi:hypothetical protein